MRKSLIAKQVEYFYNKLDLVISEKTSGGNTYKVIDNWFSVSTALYKLNEYDFIGNSINDIFALGAAFQSSSNTISIISSNYNDFVTKFNLVKAKCEAIIDSSNYNDNINDLFIKLPDKTPDILELSAILKDLDLVFNKCPIFSEKIGNMKFKKVEEGSNWLVLSIGAAVIGSKVLEWIANFVKACNEIRIQNKTIKNIELDNIIKEMQIEDKNKEKKYKENIEKAESAKIRTYCLNSFKELKITNDNISSEQEGQIINCMKTLAELLDLGIEIYPSVSSEEEIKNLFPKHEELKLIDEAQKLLEEPKENNK